MHDDSLPCTQALLMRGGKESLVPTVCACILFPGILEIVFCLCISVDSDIQRSEHDEFYGGVHLAYIYVSDRCKCSPYFLAYTVGGIKLTNAMLYKQLCYCS